MMQDGEERRFRRDELDQLAEAAEQPASEATVEDRTRFSSDGLLPPVETDPVTRKPTASELAFDDEVVETKAPPKEKGEAKGAKAKADETKPAAEAPQLLKDFSASFVEAGKLILASPKAVKLVKQAEDAGAKFGGFAEDGPSKDTWPYTVGNSVYIPKAHTDPLTAMADFLFELNNAIRAPKFAEVYKDAAAGKLTNKSYARKKVELEVEGMLQLGEVWFETKKSAGKEKDKTWSSHDGEFYLEEYEAYKAGKKSKDDIVNEVLKWKYSQGTDAGKTVEQFYMEQYDASYGKK
jgi:hypothetical protein